jgi:hypothetical protein
MATRKPVMSIARAVSIAVLSLLSIAIVLASSRTVLGASAEDPGTIAYVRRSPNQIRLIQPDGTNDHSLWTSPTPDSVVGITNLAWRPDGAMLAFSSDHEDTCSWYETDVYTIRSNGAGLRRVTNSPACADLSSYPQGAVIVNVASLGKTGHFSVYVQGSAELKGITLAGMDSGQVTFDHVADLGPHIVQPAVGIYGLYATRETLRRMCKRARQSPGLPSGSHRTTSMTLSAQGRSPGGATARGSVTRCEAAPPHARSRRIRRSARWVRTCRRVLTCRHASWTGRRRQAGPTSSSTPWIGVRGLITSRVSI